MSKASRSTSQRSGVLRLVPLLPRTQPRSEGVSTPRNGGLSLLDTLASFSKGMANHENGNET